MDGVWNGSGFQQSMGPHVNHWNIPQHYQSFENFISGWLLNNNVGTVIAGNGEQLWYLSQVNGAAEDDLVEGNMISYQEQ